LRSGRWERIRGISERALLVCVQEDGGNLLKVLSEKMASYQNLTTRRVTRKSTARPGIDSLPGILGTEYARGGLRLPGSPEVDRPCLQIYKGVLGSELGVLV
jgi:hypothetical protein